MDCSRKIIHNQSIQPIANAPADFFVRWTLRADINYYTIQKKREL